MQSGTYSFKGAAGAGLTGRYWLPDAEPRAIVSLTHGLGEHKGRYAHVGQFFCDNGIGLYAYDQRGHGNSDGKRGHTPTYEHLLNDLASHLEVVKIKHPNPPLFVYGHSLGGNVVANYLIKGNTSQLAGGILSSPWLYLAFDPPRLQVALAGLVRKIAPSLTQANQLNPEHLSTDPAVALSYEDDPLVHNKISVALFFGAYPAGKEAVARAGEVKVPVFAFHGTDDQITGMKGTEAFVAKAPHANFTAWPGMRHETHNEPEKEKVLSAICSWVLESRGKKEEG